MKKARKARIIRVALQPLQPRPFIESDSSAHDDLEVKDLRQSRRLEIVSRSAAISI
jgi:hypothetical protein